MYMYGYSLVKDLSIAKVACNVVAHSMAMHMKPYNIRITLCKVWYLFVQVDELMKLIHNYIAYRYMLIRKL